MNQSSILSDTLIRLYKLVPRVKLYENTLLLSRSGQEEGKVEWLRKYLYISYDMSYHII